ncbi:hypothetical protein AB0K21_44370 [Streptosporangium sp. NPDC049248]|uniref:hypothetical protein n=1 Tax=Streptosporangium sp. NPDC049248 TaxID=3155651 RepID=UPI00344706E3
MTSRSTNFRFADDEFEALLRQAHATQIAELNAGWDFDAGLADVYARAGGTPPPSTTAALSDPVGLELDDQHNTAELDAVEDVCAHIEMIDALLAAVSKIGEGPVLHSSYLRMARQYLMQLRLGLAGRRLTAPQAFGLISTVNHDLREADRALRLHHGLSLEQALHERIGELREINTDLSHQMEILDDKVMRLFNEADEPASLTPTPH